ncbi:Kelch-like protein 17 [Araneus ventricosus]|uniref:Kelch-like protein 17 n=1 Tax=Araneus ventricosus TaxID=182803 RepID=A0A4Y2VNZ2_ARAVE|nr:Kelch-like protein 17 [Araneus ventricosus]
MSRFSPAKFEDIFNRGFWEGQQQLCDGILKTHDGATFRIHRVILSLQCEYFCALYRSNSNQETVVIPYVDSKTLESILLFIYTGTIEVSENNLCDLAIASNFLLLDGLLKRCRKFAIKHMRRTNCLSFLSIAWKTDRLAIMEDCYRYAMVHFEDILKTSNGDLEKLPVEVLKTLLKNDSLNVVSERSTWKAIVLWTEADSSIRLNDIPELLTCLRLEKGTDEDLIKDIVSHPIVNRNPHVCGVIPSDEFSYYTVKCKILSQDANLEPQYQNLPCSYGPRMPKNLHIIARHKLTPAEDTSEIFLTYDGDLDFWRQIGETEFGIENMIQIERFIYMFKVEQMPGRIFDIVEEKWLPRSVLPVPAYRSWIIKFKEQLYSFGVSVFDHEKMYSIFSYEFQRNKWENTGKTPYNVIYGAVTVRDQIYVVGQAEVTFDEFTPLLYQAYDLEKNTWKSLPAPNIYRQGLSLVSFHEKVFAIGGNTREEYLSNVEVYDPLKNTWMGLPDLPFVYISPKAVVVDNKLIVHESNEENKQYQDVSPLVYWDEVAQLWKNIEKSTPWYFIDHYAFLALDDGRVLKDMTAKRPGKKWKRILHD